MARMAMMMAHEIRKSGKYASLSYKMQMSVCLKIAWAKVKEIGNAKVEVVAKAA